MNDDAFYDEVAAEIDANKKIPGVWARAVAAADGDKDRAHAFYIKYRVAQLAAASNQRIVEEKQKEPVEPQKHPEQNVEVGRLSREPEKTQSELRCDLDSCIPQQYRESLERHFLAAENGEAESQFLLGEMYHEGRGVFKNREKAVKWYRLAAEQGHAAAQNKLARGYLRGMGIPQDYLEAVKWFRRAAEQGNIDAQTSMGHCYFYGRGVLEDHSQAYAWLQIAVAQGGDEATTFQQINIRELTQSQIEEGKLLARAYDVKFVRRAENNSTHPADKGIDELLAGLPVTPVIGEKDHGGIGRAEYCGWSALLAVVCSILLSKFGATSATFVYMPVVLITSAILGLIIGGLRFRNIGYSPGNILLSFIPIVNLGVTYICMAYPAGYAKTKKADIAMYVASIGYWIVVIAVTILVIGIWN